MLASHTAALSSLENFPAAQGAEAETRITPHATEADDNAVTAGEGIENEAAEGQAGTLTLNSESETDAVAEFDTGDIVEAAEQMLRESAPHDFQVLVIGGGPGGCAAALRAADLGARVGLIEASSLGGNYLNDFVPTRDFLEATHYIHKTGVKPDLKNVGRHTDSLVEKLREEMQETLTSRGVTIISGTARFVEEHCIEVRSETGTRRVKAVHVIVAAGARATLDMFSGEAEANVVERSDLLRRSSVPARLVVAGAGSVGIETAYLFQMLGSRVTLLAPDREIMPAADGDVRRSMVQILRGYGVEVETSRAIIEVRQAANGLMLRYDKGTQQKAIEADALVLADNYRIDEHELALQIIGVEVKDGRIVVDDEFQTNIGGVYAIGGCVHGLTEPQLARAEGRFVAEHVLGYPARQKPSKIPSCCFTYPAAASVGMAEEQVQHSGVSCSIGIRRLHQFGTPESEAGFIKVIIDDESRRLLGCHVVGASANELINLAAAAMDANRTADEVAETAYTECSLGPDLSAAIRAAR